MLLFLKADKLWLTNQKLICCFHLVFKKKLLGLHWKHRYDFVAASSSVFGSFLFYFKNRWLLFLFLFLYELYFATIGHFGSLFLFLNYYFNFTGWWHWESHRLDIQQSWCFCLNWYGCNNIRNYTCCRRCWTAWWRRELVSFTSFFFFYQHMIRMCVCVCVLVCDTVIPYTSCVCVYWPTEYIC